MSAALAAHCPTRAVLRSSYLRPIVERPWNASSLRHRPAIVNVGTHFCRLYASIPPTDVPRSKPAQGSGLPPPDPPRKPKVELRPSPKLLDPPTSRIATLPSSTHAVVLPVNTTSSSMEQPSSGPPAVDQRIPIRSAIDTAIADVQQAARSGDIVSPAPDASMIRKGFHYAVELFKFYWRGLKAVLKNREIVTQIQTRLREEGREMTWREKRFVEVYKSDSLKVVPFALTFAIVEEIIPLIVIYAPFLLPSTCILPSQQARMEATRVERQRKGVALLWSVQAAGDKVNVDNLQDLPSDALRGLCGMLSVSTFGPWILVHSRLRARLDRLAEDDDLLQDALPALDLYELRQAVNERGGFAEQLSEERLRAWVRKWLEDVRPGEDKATLEQRVLRALMNNALRS